jgi:hypothetical protein
MYIYVYINIYIYVYIYVCLYEFLIVYSYFHRGINVDHGSNVDQHSKPRNKCKCSIHTVFAFV